MTLREMIHLIRVDLGLAKGFRIQSVIFLFRVASYAYKGQSVLRHIFRPVALFYRIYTQFLLGIELPPGTSIGAGLRIHHGFGLVVHKGVRIGTNCMLRQNVTIGNKGDVERSNLLPVIGDNVEFGAGSVVIGGVSIGSNVIIGAGCVVHKDVPDNSVVVGAGFRVLPRKM